VTGKFEDLADAGRKVAELVDPVADSIVLAVLPNGVPAALALGERHGLPVYGVSVERGYLARVAALPVAIEGQPEVNLADRPLLVVDDGVETGSAALAVGKALRDLGASEVTLVVPVCPREAEAKCTHLYDEIVAADRPMVRRSLRWHYVNFDVLDDAEALARLTEYVAR